MLPTRRESSEISLRSVHGKYLVRLLDKSRDAEAAILAPHGTQVRLKVRSTARLGSVLDIMRQWVVVPRCQVTVKIDDDAPAKVGHASVAEAVASYLQEAGLSIGGDQPQYKVISRDIPGLEFAYAVRWSPSYRDWTIANVLPGREKTPSLPCTCVEGVAVVFGTPGLTARSLIALANARGPTAPKTNVARSTLEATPERDALISNLYGLYVDHVKNEIDRLVREEKYSLTWAANNAIMLVPFGFSNAQDALLPSELRERMKTLPVYIVEKNGKRTNIAFNDLTKEKTFWTVDCQLVQSAEGLVKESKADSTVASVVNALGDKAQQLPSGTILYNMDISTPLRDSVEREFEPLHVIASESLRRADIEWGPRAPDKWIRVDEIMMRKDQRARTQFDERMMRYLDDLVMRNEGSRQVRRQNSLRGPLWLASPEVPFQGIESYCGISSYYRTFLRGDLSITGFLRDLALRSEDDDVWKRLCVFTAVFNSIAEFRLDRVNIASSRLRRIAADLGEEFTLGSEKFLEALNEGPPGLFDTSVWIHRTNDWL